MLSVAPADPAAAAAAASDQEEYLGMVKSYNARRGFGFIACEATAAKFGRDVYIAKAEVHLIAAAGGLPAPAPAVRLAPGEKPPPPALEEEDLVRFRVKLSAEGYPQAEHIRCIHKLQGIVLEAPGEAATDEQATVGRIMSDELAVMHGAREISMRRANCGRTRLAVGDRVTFCVQQDRPGEPLDALLVMLVPRQHNLGGIIGCCLLSLPRVPAPNGWGCYRPDLQLDCHALGDRLILSGLPPDCDQAELMRFFGKHGAAQIGVATSRTGAFASVAFPGTAEVARFMARSAHTFADDKETRLAILRPRCAACLPATNAGAARLPGLPAPHMAPGAEAGVLVVTWSSVVLATGYTVELRPAGVQAPWSAVDASEGKLGGSEGGRFGKDCSSCKVTGLPANVVFEARVTYSTACGCSSDASDLSEWCLACPQAAPMASGGQYALPSSAGMGMPAAPMGVGHMGWPAQMPQHMHCAGWRCAHGMVVPQPSMPEISAADEYGFSLLVQWPSVGTASAYVVELRESGSPHAERFVRQVPMQAVGSSVELRIGGLRPGGPGRIYVAQVRSVSACGCESEASAPAVSQPMGYAPPFAAATAVQPVHQPQPQAPLPTLSLAAACAPPQCPPPQPPPAELGQIEQAKLAPWQAALPSKSAAFASVPGAAPGGGAPVGLPSLLQSTRTAPPPPPVGSAPEVVGGRKEVAPEITPNEDCIILD
uniref:Fibronectin type-III domain-containing protein n=1 Tax=Zooxanthella nutricula TaxID=1333877 RepID=A0A7S2ITW4_9DINO